MGNSRKAGGNRRRKDRGHGQNWKRGKEILGGRGPEYANRKKGGTDENKLALGRG